MQKMACSPPGLPDELDLIESHAKALLALVALKRREKAEETGPRFYTGKSYPFGERRFRRDIAAGMVAHREGKSYVVRVEDAEAFWASRRHRAEPPKPEVSSTDEERWARSGLRVVGTRKAAGGSR